VSEAFLDIGPLFESQWTGISVVTEQLARAALQDQGMQWAFIYDDIPVGRNIVGELLDRRSGGSYLSYLEEQLWEGKSLRGEDTSKAAAVFLNVKPPINKFRNEALIVHDLSTLVAPEFHNEDTIRYHANRISRDIRTTDRFFCFSDATASDLGAYFQVESSKITLLPMGISMDPCDLAALTARRWTQAEPYVCMLGTIEPRKNGSIILSYMKMFPSFLDKYKVVFVGRDGWLDEKTRLLEVLRRQSIKLDRIIFTGFVTESRKLSLLYFSRFCIYPSFFEGFGIPVAEAGRLGKFVVCSNMSSLPEVEPERCFFFDPHDMVEFTRAMHAAQTASELTLLHQASFGEVWSLINERSWDKAYRAVRAWIRGE
jgi:glycosyltransferase involved in cell wall biosynthesis